MSRADKILQAEKEIKREGAKAAFLHASVEATLVLIGVALLVPRTRMANTDLGPAPATAVVAAGVGVLVFAVDFYVTYRRRTLEMFERVNPHVEEALRTARDAAHGGETGEMAEILYDDVLRDLREASGERFVSERRILGAFALAIGLALLVSVASLSGIGGGSGDGLFGSGLGAGGAGGSGSDEGEGQSNQDGSKDSDSFDKDRILGEKAEVIRGDNSTVSLGLRQTGGGGSGGSVESYPSGSGDVGGVGDVGGSAASFDTQEEIEDAKLVKEYNLRIADDDGDG